MPEPHVRLRSKVPYRVTIPSTLVATLSSQQRTRLWLELAAVAQLASDYPQPRPRWVEQLGLEEHPTRLLADNVWMSYALNEAERTVTLLQLEQRPKLDADP